MAPGRSEAFARLNARATLWLARLASVALAVIALATFCDVVGRYVFNRPFTFTVELTEMAMALVVYFGVGIVTHEGSHISADIVTIRLPPRWRALVAVVTNVLAFAFLVLMVWRLWVQAALLRESGDTSQVLGVPLWPVAVAVAFGALFLLTGVLLQLVAAVQRLRGGDNPAPSAATAPYRE